MTQIQKLRGDSFQMMLGDSAVLCTLYATGINIVPFIQQIYRQSSTTFI